MNGDLKLATGCGCVYGIAWVLFALASLAGSAALIYAIVHFLLTH